MTEKNVAFPSLPQAVLLVGALFAMELVVGIVLNGARNVLGITSAQTWTLGELLANGLVFATVMQYRGLTYRGLFHPAGTSMRATAANVVPWVLLLVPALVITLSMVVNVITGLFPLSDSNRAMFEEMAGNDLATLLMGCVIAPVVEEMLFRGVILRGFLQRYDRGMAIWASSALFGLAHLNVYQFAVGLLMGAVCGWLYTRARSLVPCVALHMAYNSSLHLLASASGEASITGGLWIACVLLAGVGVHALQRAFAQADAAGKN